MPALVRNGEDTCCSECDWWTCRPLDEGEYYSQHHHGGNSAVYFDIHMSEAYEARVFLCPDWKGTGRNEYLYEGNDLELALSIYNQWVRELSTE